MPGGRSSEIDDVELDVSALMRALGRALPLLFVLALVAGAAILGTLTFLTPRYTAETKLLIETGESDITRNSGASEETRALLDAEGVASQVQLIASRDLARSVVDALKIGDLPEFDPSRAWSLERLLSLVGVAPREKAPGAREEGVLELFGKRREVYSVDKTRVITIDFSSADPALAARVANAIADEYLSLEREAKRTTNSDAMKWLDAQISDLRTKVRDAEAKVEAYRASSDLFTTAPQNGNSLSLSQQQLSDLNAERGRLQAARSAAEAKAATIRQGLAAGTALDSTDVLDSQLIQRLREQQVALKAQIAQLSATLLPAHPRIRELNAQLGDLDAQIRSEANRILKSLEGEAGMARAREAEIGRELGLAKTATAQSNDAEVQLRALEREAAAQRDLLETYLRRYREAASRQAGDYLPADARIISRAAVPLEPSFPRKGPITAAATTALLLLAITFVLIRELMSGRALRPIGRRSAVAIPVVEVPPAFAQPVGAKWPEEGDVRRVLPVEPTIAPQGADGNDDALRAVVARVRKAKASKLILVTATEAVAAEPPPAGVALARALTQDGGRTLLIELREGGATGSETAAEGEVLPGFSDLFAADASFAQVIFRDRRSRAHVIPYGRRVLPADAVQDQRFGTILAALDQTYDHIVIEVGPEMAAAVAARAGAVVLVSDAGATDPATLKAYEALAAAGPADVMLLLAEDEAAKADTSEEAEAAVA